jgi:hypothetical protein
VTSLIKLTWIPLITIVALFVILAAGALTFTPGNSDLSPRLDYVGQTYESHGWWGEYCEMHDSAPVVSRTKIAAQVRETDCSHDPTTGSAYIFVFVRPMSSKNSLKNLVLRLQEGDHDSGVRPELSWIQPTTLRIEVWDDDYWIERQSDRALGVKIVYRFHVRAH